MNDKKQSILFILTGDSNKASSRVRGFWIAEELEKEGFNCTLRWKRGKLALLKLAYEILLHDIVIFQKTQSRYHRWLMALANKLGKRTYLDIDDAPSRINSPVTLANFESMLRMSDGVFAGSSNLLKYTKQHQAKSYLIPSSINLKYYLPSEKRESNKAICLGWIGNGKHYKSDLIKILEAPLRELAAHYRLRFKVVGACGVKELYDVFKAIPNLEIDFIDAIEWSNPNAVSKAISDFDVGLYPLLANEFNHYKCGFKALEYMAMSIPVVASPVANNADIIEHNKTGMLVDTRDEWVMGLNELIKNSRKRVQMGMSGRKKVESDYCIVSTTKKLSSILSSTKK